MIEAYKGNEPAETVAAEAYKLSTMWAWRCWTIKIPPAWYSSLMLGSRPRLFLNKFMVAADQTYKDAIFKAVLPTTRMYTRDGGQWYDRMWTIKNTRR